MTPFRAMAKGREVRRMLTLTLIVNLALVIGKLVVGFSAHSLSIVADAAHSSVDAWSNVMSLLLARLAAKAPDEEHPYGHAKFETLGALAIVAFLSIAVFELVSSALRRLFGVGPHVHPGVAAVIVMTISAAASLVLAHFEKKLGHQHDSHILLADSAHTRSDFFASVAVLIGIGAVALGFHEADAIVTLLVALVIAHAGYDILRTSVPVLVDERAVEVEAIRVIALSSPGVFDCFDVRSRGRPGEIFVELSISVDPSLNVEDAHIIADSVERRVASAVSAREVVAHVEPYGSRIKLQS